MENLRSKPFWDRSPLESLAAGHKKIPLNFKLTMLAAFVFGLAAHMYCYTNMLTGADDSALFTQGFSWADGASGTRWLIKLYWDLLGTIRTPWLLGVVTLALYGAAAWFVCEALGITSRAGVVLVSGLMVTDDDFLKLLPDQRTNIRRGAAVCLHGCLCLRKMAARLDRRVCVYAAV